MKGTFFKVFGLVQQESDEKFLDYSLCVFAQVEAGAGHCHGTATEEAEACGDSDDGQPLHLHPHQSKQQPRQNWATQDPHGFQTLLGQVGPKLCVLEPPAADPRLPEQSHPGS